MNGPTLSEAAIFGGEAAGGHLALAGWQLVRTTRRLHNARHWDGVGRA
jgi:hypothetical protein